MTELYYELASQTWYQNVDQEEKVSLGKYFSVPYKSEHTSKHLTIPFLLKDSKAGPLVGILASPKKDGFVGNIGLFKRIQENLQQHGGLSIVFTPKQLTENGVDGFCYLPHHDHWIRMQIPLPDIIYNRLSRYEDEKLFLHNTEKLASLYHIPVFNPHFFDKWELYLQLQDNDQLVQHLPKTDLLTEDSLSVFLSTYKEVYIKKRKSKKGKGIYLIRRNGNTFLLRTTSTTTVLFPSLTKLALFLQKEEALDSYIIQEAIPTLPMKGKKFDYRILAHASHNRFTITGVGVRLAKKQQVTTHVPSGGVIVSTDDLPVSTDLETMAHLINQCGKQLTSFYDDIGEFSADVGLTRDGKLYIFELNAKPMDFDEPAIKQQAAENITRVFYERTEYSLQESTP
ncbi:YheC/YheD family protein [Sutcliffiella horikoshii]|uniref:YheC/YheD family endospore coat-associated protein n=1 Tax=Sutcliffiella horikoshii TaxID=79883 RepID=UPI002040B32C|nr:YheC/YheD family protein [Sutcliffiella horikoshii]MCM3617011.1 YheC/YheD family protein [Sutcliffiella horikoshii]